MKDSWHKLRNTIGQWKINLALIGDMMTIVTWQWKTNNLQQQTLCDALTMWIRPQTHDSHSLAHSSSAATRRFFGISWSGVTQNEKSTKHKSTPGLKKHCNFILASLWQWGHVRGSLAFSGLLFLMASFINFFANFKRWVSSSKPRFPPLSVEADAFLWNEMPRFCNDALIWVFISSSVLPAQTLFHELDAMIQNLGTLASGKNPIASLPSMKHTWRQSTPGKNWTTCPYEANKQCPTKALSAQLTFAALISVKSLCCHKSPDTHWHQVWTSVITMSFSTTYLILIKWPYVMASTKQPAFTYTHVFQRLSSLQPNFKPKRVFTQSHHQVSAIQTC